MTRNAWSRLVARLFDKKNQTGESTRRRRLTLEWLEARLAPAVDAWTGAIDNKWATAGNWTLGRPPQAGDDLIFDSRGSARITNNNLVGLSVNSITISAAGYTLGGLNAALGNQVTLSAGGGGFTIASGIGTTNLALDLQLGAAPASLTSFTFTVNAGSSLNVTGRLNGVANSTLAKLGTGSMTLATDNSTVNGGLNGAIDIQAGVVTMTNAKALGSTVSGTTVKANAQLQIQAGAAGFTINEVLDLNGPGLTNTGALYNAAGNNTWAGTIALDSNTYIGAFSGTQLDINGQISDLGSGQNLDKVGAGQIIFSHQGGNTYRGLTTVQDGILTIRDPLSLGASGTPQNGTVVAYNPTAGQVGTLQMQFVSLNSSGDPNGILQDPTKVFNASTNPYIGFQVFDEQLTLNGPGFNGLGSLNNLDGKNTWNGNVLLGSPVANSTLVTQVKIGVTAPGAGGNTDLTIAGVISDPNNPDDPFSFTNPKAKVAPQLTKVLGGRLILNNNNTYHGDTDIAAGVVQVSDSHALGKNAGEVIAGDNTPGGTVVVETGAVLELAVDSGLEGTALKTHGRNLGFDSAPLTVASPNTNNGPGQELYITRRTNDFFTLTFNGITTLNNGLNFSSATLASDIQTALNNLNSVFAIGGVDVTQTGNVFRVAYRNLALASAAQLPLITFNALDRTAITVNPIYGLNVVKAITIHGTGIGSSGAIHSVSGINIYSGAITLDSFSATDSIGVDLDTRIGHPTADAFYFTRDYSLTIKGSIQDDFFAPAVGATFAKVGTGHLILPTANSYTGKTDIQQGWVTINNSNALGIPSSTLGVTIQPPVIVEDGAALHLKPLTSGAHVDLNRNLILTGNGITHAFGAISQEGALLNLGSVNTVTGNIILIGNAGIGVQNLDANPLVNPSQLTLTGSLSDNPLPSAPGGLTKLGTNRLVIQGDGTYTGSVNVQEGTLGVRNDTALGRQTSGTATNGSESFTTTSTTVQTGATLELGDNIPSNYGGVQAGVQVTDEQLILNRSGQQLGISGIAGKFSLTFNGATTTTPLDVSSLTLASDIQTALNALSTIGGATGGSVTVTKSGYLYTVVFGGTLAGQNNPLLVATKLVTSAFITDDVQVTIIGSTAPLTTQADDNLGKDIMWRGPVTLATNTVIDVAPNSRLTLLGVIDDATNAAATGSSLTKRNNGELVLGGANTYRGTTFITQGIVTDANDQALGAAGDVESVQDLTLTGSYQFNLSINGQTTGILDISPATLATLAGDIALKLNALSTISGGGGSVTVAQTSATVFRVTFTGGSLLGVSQQLLTVNILTLGTVPAASRNPSAGASRSVAVISTGSGGTIVRSGGQLQLRGNLNVSAETLTVEGTGAGAANAPTDIPVRWFGVGPAPINNGQTAGNQAVTGRVTGIAVDPTDSNVIYISTAGGGAWKTKNGGKTWTQLFDSISATQTISIGGTSGSFTLTFMNNAGVSDTTVSLAYNSTAEQVQAALNSLTSIRGNGTLATGSVTVTLLGTVYTITFSGGSLAGTKVSNAITATSAGGAAANPGQVVNPPNSLADGTGFALFSGAIAVAPSDPSILYLGTGETNNSGDSYYGTGVYKSTDSGKTWKLLTDQVGGVNPLYGLGVSKIVVDPRNPNLIYVATSDQVTNAPKTAVAPVPGIYRYSNLATAPALANSWFNLTDQTSSSRASLVGKQQAPVAFPPNSPGPDDDFRLVFPQSNANWTDISLVYISLDGASPATPVLYASLGTESGNTSGSVIPSNAVFRNESPDSPAAVGSPSPWYVGIHNPVNVSEVQTITVTSTSGAPAGGGKFQLSFKNVTTVTFISFTNLVNDAAAMAVAIQGALQGLTTVGAGNVSVAVSGTPTLNKADFTVTFQGALANSGEPLIGVAGVAPAPDVAVAVARTTAGGGADDRSNGEFPAGAYSYTALPNQPRNGTIKFSTYVDPNITNPTFGQVTIYAAITVPTAFNPNTGQRWYPNTYGQLLEIQKSSDGGRTWAAVASPPNYLGTAPDAQGTYDTAIVASSASHVYVAGVVTGAVANKGYIFESTTGGGAWNDISVDTAGNGPHTNAHAFALDGNGHVLLGNDGGIWSLTASTDTWRDINGNLAITSFNGISQHPFDPNTILGGSQSNGAELTTGSQAWTLTDTGNSGPISYDPRDPSIAYHVRNGSLMKSIDGGVTWLNSGGFPYAVTGATVFPFPNTNYFPLVVDPISSRVVLGGSILQESLDQGATWNTALDNNLPLGFSPSIVAIATYQGNKADGTYQEDTDFTQVHDRGANTYDPDTFYVSNGSSIYVTKDHGQSWQQRNAAGFNGIIQDVVVDPSNRDTAYFTSSSKSASGKGRVFKTTDAGQSWTDISGNLPDVPAWKIVVDPRTNTIYLGNENGVWDLPGSPGASWQRFGSGLPEVQVTDLDLNITLNTLTAGTYGRSAFQAYLGEVVADSGALRVVSGSSTWTGPIRFTAPTTITVDGTQSLQNGAGFARLDIKGVISDLVAGANNAFIKDGKGDLVLSGTNTYGGSTDVKAGVLIVNNSQALGTFDLSKVGVAAQGGTVVEAGASLELQSDLLGEPVQISGDGIFPGLNGHNTGALRNISSGAQGNTFSGPLTLASNATIGVDSNSQLNIIGKVGELSSQLKLTKELSGNLGLAGANTYSGATIVNEGILSLQNSLALGTGPSTSATVLDGAQLQIQGTGIQIAQTLTLSGTGFGLVGSGALLNTGGDNKVTGNVVFTALPNFSTFTTPSGVVAIGASAGTSLTISGPISQATVGGVAQTSGLSKLGLGRVVLQNANTYTGSTYVSQGVLEIQNNGALGNRTTTNAVQRIVTLNQVPSPGVAGDTFTVSFPGYNTVQTFSTTLAYGATAAQVRNAINAMLIVPVGSGGAGYSATAGDPNQLQVTVTRADVQTTVQATTANPSGAGPAATGYVYTVTFTGTLNQTSQQLTSVGAGGVVSAASRVADGGVGTLVADGAELDLHSTTASVPISVPSTMEITLNGTGVNGGGALHNLSGLSDSIPNTVAGRIDVQTASTINVDGAGTLALTGTGFGAGLTKTGLGSLQVDGVFSNNSFTLNAGSLSGTGTVGAVNAVAGTLSPGDNLTTQIGTLTTGPIGSLNASDQVFVDLGATTVSDLLMVNGSINLNGASLSGSLLGALSGHVVGDTFTIIKTDFATNPSDVITGTFAGPSLGGGDTQVNIGTKNFRVHYTPQDVTLTQINDSTSTTLMSALNPSVYGQQLTFTASVSFTGAGTPTGTVTFVDGVTTLGTGTYDSLAQTWTYKTTNAQLLTVGSHSITAVYTDPTNTFPTSTSNALIQVVNKDASKITLVTSPNPSSSGQPVTFTATVTPFLNGGTGKPTGTVTFFDGATDLSGPINVDPLTGIATFPTSILSVGNHSITAVYNGDPNYTAKTSAIKNQNVLSSQPTSTAVVSSLAPSLLGQAVTFTATVTNQGSGSAIPGGSVEFYDGLTDLGAGTSIGNGQWTLATAALTVGAHSITAVYSGDSNYVTSTSPVFTQTVNPLVATHTTTTTVTSSANPSFVNQAVTYTATVTSTFAGTPGGNVVFKDGATTLGNGVYQGNGVWTLVTTPSTTGAHSITAVYGGDSVYTTSTSAAFTQTVNTLPANASTTSVSSSVNPSLPGQAVTFTATVGGASGPPSTGTVDFFDGATFLGSGTFTSNGQWTLTTATLALGNRSITATFSGNATYATSTSAIFTQTVSSVVTGNHTSFTSVVTSSANPSAVGQAVTFSVTVGTAPGVANANDGTVTFFDNGVQIGTGTVSNGRASFTTSSLALGSHSITATYGGNSYFAQGSSPSALTQTVQAVVVGTHTSFTSVVTSSANPASLGQAVTLSVTVGTAQGVANANDGVVTFFDNGLQIGTGTVSNGRASFTTSSLALGSHSILAVYGGNSYFAAGSSPSALTQIVKKATTTSMTSSAQSVLAGSTLTFTATVTSPSGTPTGQVAFYDSGFFFGYGTYVGNNQWRFTTNIFTTVGDHFLTAVYLGDSTFNASQSPAYRQTITGNGRG